MVSMEIERANADDVDALMDIFAKARRIMRESGNDGQWTNGYPQRTLVERCIAKGGTYKVLGEDGIIHGTFYMALEDDHTYHVIENGGWMYDEPYAVIHRIAQDGTLSGLLAAALDYTCAFCRYIRIDTHEKNVIMRHLLEKNGFRKAGTIYTDDGSPRADGRIALTSVTKKRYKLYGGCGIRCGTSGRTYDEEHDLITQRS